MKMAKPSERDIDAAGDMMSLLNEIDRGYYPISEEDSPTFFDEDDPKHLRAFYDAVKATLAKGPGWPGRVIGGMCYVIMYDKNEIIDPDSDVIDLHPKLAAALEMSKSERAPSTDSAGEDGERLRFAMQDIDGFGALVMDKYDYAIQIAKESGRDVPTADDELNGIRRLIDAAKRPQDTGEAKQETDDERLARQAAFRKTTICGAHAYDTCTLVCIKCGYAWGADAWPVAAMQPQGNGGQNG